MIKLLRRIAFAALTLHVPLALAAYPDHAIKLVVPYSAGGAADVTARLIAQQLSTRVGQPVVVDNRPGAGGSIGAAAVASAPADGYTLLLDATSFAVNPSLLPKLPYDTVKDFTPISLVMRVPTLLVVPANSPARSVADLVKMAKDKPGTVTFASAGNGGAQHLAGELFAQDFKLKLVHVPYKGGAPALTDLMGGQVDMMFSAASASGPHVKSGKLRGLASTGVKRSAAFPDLPTMTESGAPDFSAYEWNGIFVRSGTPQPIVDKLEAEIRAIVALPEVRQRLADLGAEPVGSTSAELKTFVQGEMTKWAKVIKDGNIRAD